MKKYILLIAIFLSLCAVGQDTVNKKSDKTNLKFGLRSGFIGTVYSSTINGNETYYARQDSPLPLFYFGGFADIPITSYFSFHNEVNYYLRHLKFNIGTNSYNSGVNADFSVTSHQLRLLPLSPKFSIGKNPILSFLIGPYFDITIYNNTMGILTEYNGGTYHSVHSTTYTNRDINYLNKIGLGFTSGLQLSFPGKKGLFSAEAFVSRSILPATQYPEFHFYTFSLGVSGTFGKPDPKTLPAKKLKKEKTKIDNRFSLGLKASPDYCDRVLVMKHDYIYPETVSGRNNLDKPGAGYSGSLWGSCKLGGVFSLETGVGYSKKSISTKYTTLQPNIINSLIYNKYKRIFGFHYLEVPLKLSFIAGKKKLHCIIGVGAIFQFFMQKSFKDEFISEQSFPFNDFMISNEKSYNIAYLLSAGVEYNLTEKSFVRIEPSYQCQLMNLNDQYYPVRLFNAGLSFSYGIRF